MGRIARGSDLAGYRGVQVALVDHAPVSDAQSYITLGLSNHLLKSPSRRQFRMELLGTSYSRFEQLRPEGNLLRIAHDLLDSHRALLRGEVIGPAGPVVPGSSLEAYYCALPVYFRDSLATFRGTVPGTVIIWMVPISHAEAHYVWEHGWNKFEDLLIARDPDLMDLARASVV